MQGLDQDAYTIRFARYSDWKRVNSIMEKMEEEIDDTNIFVADDSDFIKNHIEKEGFIVVAGHKKRIAAFLIVRFPKESEDNLGYDLDFSEDDLMRVNHMESVIVTGDHRGNALMRQLIEFAEPVAKIMGYTIAMATVSPDNPYSLNNFLAMGYREVMKKTKYDGVERVILRKDL